MLDALLSLPFEAILAGVAIGIAVAGSIIGTGPRRRKSKGNAYGPRPVAISKAIDAPAQLRIVERTSYQRKRVLNRSETKLFAVVEAIMRQSAPDWRVFAQVVLGEILSCDDEDGFRAINAKRVDLLIVDADVMPACVIEYQGSGHHLSPAAARDAIKREALRKAGIDLIEVTVHDSPTDVRRMLGKVLQRRGVQLAGVRPAPSALTAGARG